MSRIILKNLTKTFGVEKAIDRINLTINDGDFLTLLGPSGCGKTTTLRCLSGLEEPDDGEIYIDDKCIFSNEQGLSIPPGSRNLGLVFQNYALWPHMTVKQNVAFGLRKANLEKSIKETKIRDVLSMVSLDGFQNRFPHELSGGQQQRVAVARMVVTQPNIFLFDEPLSNLDAKLRMTLRAELKRMHLDIGATTVYVTHDQIEAMTLSTRIALMNAGTIQQVGTPQEVYHFPSNLFVADFMGNPSTNLIHAKAQKKGSGLELIFDIAQSAGLSLEEPENIHEGQKVVINVRPEDVDVFVPPTPLDLKFKVYTSLPAGSEALTYLRSPDENSDFIVKGPEEHHRDLRPEMEVGVNFKKGNVFDAESGMLLYSFAKNNIQKDSSEHKKTKGSRPHS